MRITKGGLHLMWALPTLYLAWRKGTGRLRHIEAISQRFSKFSGQKSVGQGLYLKRYARREMTPQILLRSLSSVVYGGARLLELQLLFLPLFATAPLLYIDEVLWFRILRATLRMAGPSFIKLGQWAATRPDLLPLGLCRVLAELHSRAPCHSLAWSREAFRRSFGVGIESIFSEFDPEPLGSGSVAQVHRAVMHGDEVAVKILHPHVHELFHVDLQLLATAARCLHAIPTFTWLHLPEEIAYFSRAMQQQLDLRYEAYTLSRFGRNFASSSAVAFPRPLLSSQEVLVESLETGLPIGFFTQAACSDPEWPAIKEEIALGGLRAFMQMLLWDNFVHADLHPGNVLVKFPGYKGDITDPEALCRAYRVGCHPTLVFLDTGLVTELSRRDFTNFTDLFKALVFKADGALAGQLIIERGPPGAATQVLDPPGFYSGMDSLVAPVFSKSSALMHLESFAISPLIFKTFDLVRQHHVRLEGAFTNLVMSLACIEGIGRDLSPQLNLRPLLLSAGLQYLASNIAQTVVETVDPFV